MITKNLSEGSIGEMMKRIIKLKESNPVAIKPAHFVIKDAK
jgi:hypothetical protein